MKTSYSTECTKANKNVLKFRPKFYLLPSDKVEQNIDTEKNSFLSSLSLTHTQTPHTHRQTHFVFKGAFAECVIMFSTKYLMY